jgi:hypothetical protein
MSGELHARIALPTGKEPWNCRYKMDVEAWGFHKNKKFLYRPSRKLTVPPPNNIVTKKMQDCKTAFVHAFIMALFNMACNTLS